MALTVSNVRAQRAATAPGQSYPRWVRTALARAAENPDAVILFDSTIREPTELLAGVVHRAFAQPITNRYESVFSSGNSFVTAAVSKRYRVDPEQVIAASSATSAMAMAIRAFVRPGERVLVEAPGFDLLSTLAREAGAIIDLLPRHAPDFSIDPDELSAAIRPDTRLILLTQLHNPSGVALRPEVLARIGDVAGAAGIPVVVDAVYADFIGAPGYLPNTPQFIVTNSLSKVHGLFALRCGWLTASRENIARIEAANPQGDLAVSKLTHAVAALVLEDLAPFDAHWRAALDATRPVVERHARAMVSARLLEGELPPYGCMYFPRVTGVDDTLALSERLWETHRLLVAPGEYFGLPGHIRIGFGGEAEPLDRGLAKLAQALSRTT